MDDKLIEKCPFCGGDCEIQEGFEHDHRGGCDVGIFIECNRCPARMESSYEKYTDGSKDATVSYLIAHWNKRATLYTVDK